MVGLGGLGRRAVRLEEIILQSMEHFRAPDHVHVFGRRHIIGRLAGVLHRERRIGHAEEAGADSRGRTADCDEARQVEILGRQLLGGHRADVRPLRQRVGRTAGADEHRPPLMIAFGRRERANDRQVLHLLGDARHVLANFDAAGARFHRLEFAGVLRAGLQVPDVDGGRPAAHPKDDQALVLFLKRRGGRPQRLDEAHAGHREGRHAGDMLEKMPAIRLILISHCSTSGPKS